MTESCDILKQIFDRCLNVIPLLPPPIFTFPLRAAAILIMTTLACRTTFEMGSRSSALQISVACFIGFFSTLLPVESLSVCLHRAGSIPCALVLVVSILLTCFLPVALPRWLVSRHETQPRITKLIFRVLLVLLVAI